MEAEYISLLLRCIGIRRLESNVVLGFGAQRHIPLGVVVEEVHMRFAITQWKSNRAQEMVTDLLRQVELISAPS